MLERLRMLCCEKRTVTYLAMGADAIVHVAACGQFHCQEDVRWSVDNLVEADDIWMLELFHCLNFTLDFLLHTELSDLVLIENLESDWLINCFIDSNCMTKKIVRRSYFQKIFIKTYASLFRRLPDQVFFQLDNCSLLMGKTSDAIFLKL